MSDSLGKTLTKETASRKRKCNTENEEPQAKQLVTIPTGEQDLNFDFTAEDILQIVGQCEKEENTISNVNNNNNQVNMKSNLVQRSPNIPGFLNCKIGNITINIQK